MSKDFDDSDNRDRPLTMDWRPLDPDAYAVLDLPKLSPNAMRARIQLITEALVAGPDRYTSYSRRKQFYARRQRYFRETYTYRSIIPAIDQLDRVGLFDHEKMPSGHRGEQSRFRGSEPLFKALRGVEVVYDPLEIILVRDFDGSLVAYQDNREMRRMRKRLGVLNEILVSQEIAIDGRIIREGSQLDKGGRAQTQLRRIFNRGCTDFGGRFYGGHWQNISEAERKLITVNGEPTIEIDYAALHIRLLYQETGKPMIGDPYEIDGWARKQVKRAMLIAINARTHRGAVMALADALAGFPGIRTLRNRFEAAKDLLGAVKAKHPNIAWAFGSDAGARLMRRDSDLAEGVMLEMLEATGIAPLSVHDSFIVPAALAGRLNEAMERKIGMEKSTNFATAYPADNSKENPKVASHYGGELLPSLPLPLPPLVAVAAAAGRCWLHSAKPAIDKWHSLPVCEDCRTRYEQKDKKTMPPRRRRWWEERSYELLREQDLGHR